MSSNSPMVLTAEQELLLAKGLTAQVAGAEEDAKAGAANLVEARKLLGGMPRQRCRRPPTDVLMIVHAIVSLNP